MAKSSPVPNSPFASFISFGPSEPNEAEVTKALDSEQEDIFKLISQNVVRQQQLLYDQIERKKGANKDALPPVPQTIKEFKEYLEQKENKEALKEIHKEAVFQKELQTQETKLQQEFIQELPNKTPLKWDNSVTDSVTQEISNNGKLYCTLTKTTHSANIKANLSDNSYKDIKDCETIEFPRVLNDGNGPFTIGIAARNSQGEPSSDVSGVCLNYDDTGKLQSFSCPQLIKFAGIGPDAVGYIEQDGEIYTLPVTRAKYKELTKEVANNKGIETIDISEKNNYEVLQGNKEEVLAFAKGVEEKALTDAERASSLGLKLDDAKASLLKDDFAKAIELLDERKDLALGIIRHESQEFDSGTKAMVRDARNVTLDEDQLKEDRPEKYGMQVLNEVRAAINLIDVELENKNGTDTEATKEAKKKLEFIAKNALANIDELNSKSVQSYNTVILDSLKKSALYEEDTTKELEKKIVFAMQMTNFEDDHRHIVTLTKVQNNTGVDNTVIEADIMLNGLTPTLKQQFDAISAEYKQKQGQLTNPTKSQSELLDFAKDNPDLQWYRDLDSYQQTMIAQNADKIASGKYVIPTQLLESMPCPRNAYDKVTAVSQGKGADPEIVNENMHCGTPASKAGSKESRQKIAENNVECLRSFAKMGIINILSFNQSQDMSLVPIKFVSKQNERPFAKQLRAVANNNDNVKYSALVLNGFRNLVGSGEDISYFKEYLSDLGKGILEHKQLKQEVSDQDLEQISKYLQDGGKDLNKVTGVINDLALNDQTKKTLIVAAEIRGLMDNVGDAQGNRQLTLTNKISYLETQLNQEKNSLHGIIEVYARAEFCKSGKDRTGYAQIRNTIYAVCQHLGINSERPEVALSVAAGGHTQEMTGIQGGTIGAHSIKHSPVLWHVFVDRMMDGILNQKSAGNNSALKTGGPKEEIIARFNEQYNEHGKNSSNCGSTLHVKGPSKLEQIRKKVSGFVSTSTSSHVRNNKTPTKGLEI